MDRGPRMDGKGASVPPPDRPTSVQQTQLRAAPAGPPIASPEYGRAASLAGPAPIPARRRDILDRLPQLTRHSPVLSHLGDSERAHPAHRAFSFPLRGTTCALKHWRTAPRGSDQSPGEPQSPRLWFPGASLPAYRDPPELTLPPSQAGVPLGTSSPPGPLLQSPTPTPPPARLRRRSPHLFASGSDVKVVPAASTWTSPPAAHPSPPATAGLASPPSEVGDPPPAGLAYPPLRNGGARQGRASGLHLDWPLRSPPPRHRSTPSGGKSPAVRHAFFRMGAVLHPQGVFIRTAPTQKNAFREEGGQVDNSLGRVMVGLSENKRQYGLET